MRKNILLKFKSNLIIFGFLLYILPLFSQPAKSDTCPDNSSTAFSSWFTGDNGFSLKQGNCNITPENYGITFYKMGFCSSDPFQGIQYSGTPSGVSPNYESCTWTYENPQGEFKLFGFNQEVTLNPNFSKRPKDGNYSFIALEIGPHITIKSKYGPINGITYYTTKNLDQHNGSVGSSDEGEYSSINIRQKTFMTEMCDPAAQGSAVSGVGTLSGFLLDSNMQTFAEAGTGNNSTSVENCGDSVHRIVGIMDIKSSSGGPGVMSINSSTTGLTTLFNIKDIGSNIYYNGNDSNGDGIIGFGSGPFSVKFEVTEN